MVAVGSLGLSVWAGASSLQLTPQKGSPKASGTIELGKDTLKIDAAGLEPNSVYTVWFVNMKPKKQDAGAGKPPFMFKTDSTGKGSYNAPLPESPVGKWSTIMVVLHPSGDPKDMKNMVPAFSAMIPAPSK